MCILFCYYIKTITDRYLKQYDSYSPGGATVAHN